MRELSVVETLMLCFTLLSFVFSVFIFYIHYSRRKAFKGDVDLGVALVFLGLSFLINTFSLLGTPALSMTVSNILGVAGYILFNWGSRKFRQIKVNHSLDISTLVAYTVLYIIFMYGVDIKSIRLMITSVFLTFYTVLILIQYVRFVQSNTIIHAVRLAFTLFLVVNVVRAAVYAIKAIEGDYSINVIVEIVWLVDLLLTEMVVFTSLLVLRDQDELQYKTMLLSVLGHDLKTPLVTVHNISSLLLDKEYPKEDVELIKMCNRAAHNGMNLLSNIIEWSKFDMNQENKVNTCSSFQLKESLKGYFGPQAEVQAITIDFQVSDDFTIAIDERILDTILRNIIGNAIQYSSSGATVFIEIAQEKNEYLFRVTDTGEGIPTEQLKRLNLSSSTISPRSNTAKGSGLGFYIIRKFVASLNGRIHVVNNEPQGTIFSVYFPVKH